MFADLHLHTSFSDGTFSPEQVAALGAEKGLSILSLTDHDTLEGCPRMAEACRSKGIQFIPGVELTAEHDGQELHLLAYFVEGPTQVLLAHLAQFQEARRTRIHDIVKRLNALGYDLKVEAVMALANCNSPGRPHVARALVDAGITRTVDEGFERFLKRNRPAWAPKFKVSAHAAIELVHESGGLAVLAHPGVNHVDDRIGELAAAGLDGLECFHPKHSTAASEYYLAAAERYRLLVTGGSDCHGMAKGKPLIGTIKLPQVYVDNLKKAAERWLRRPVAAS